MKRRRFEREEGVGEEEARGGKERNRKVGRWEEREKEKGERKGKGNK